MSSDFPMTPLCPGCGSAEDLYGSNYEQTPLCLSCGITGLVMELNLSKDETLSACESNVAAKYSPSPSPRLLTAPTTGPFTEDEIRAVLLAKTNMTTLDLVSMFMSRLRRKEDKEAFKDILMRICEIVKINGSNYLALRDTRPLTAPTTGRVTEDEVRAVLLANTSMTTQDPVYRLKSRLTSKEDKEAVGDIQVNGSNYVALRDSRPLTAPITGRVTKDEVRDVLQSNTSMTTQDRVHRLKSRLRSKEDKEASADILRRFSKILQINESKYVALTVTRQLTTPTTGRVTKDDVRDVLLANTSMTVRDLVRRFSSRLGSKEDKEAFKNVMKNIVRLNKINGINYVVLKDSRKMKKI